MNMITTNIIVANMATTTIMSTIVKTINTNINTITFKNLVDYRVR